MSETRMGEDNGRPGREGDERIRLEAYSRGVMSGLRRDRIILWGRGKRELCRGPDAFGEP